MSVRPFFCCAVVCLLLAAFSSAVHAAWKPRETSDLRQSARQEYLRRADALYARVVPGAVAATRPHGEAAPDGAKAPSANRAPSGPVTATAAAPGQGGYVHYFLIRKPDGTAEMQVGIELPDQSIAWAFPSLGISVSPFIEAGSVEGRDGVYEVRHLFGLRPFPDDGTMAKLAEALPVRVMPWIDDGVQHCDFDPPRREACVSCLGFVLRMLFPGEFPVYPALPADFKRTRAGERYTTEDLLIYLTGLHTVETREARLLRINTLDVPQTLREELVRVVSADAAEPAPAPATQVPARGARGGIKAPAFRTGWQPRRL
ncbi:MAG: hypothetical protein ACM3SS_19215 [Rhodospirillaceae bacterium]